MQSHRRRAIFALVLVLNASVHLHDLRGFVQPGSLRTTRADSRCSDVVCGASFGRAAVAAALNAGMALVENFNKLFEFPGMFLLSCRKKMWANFAIDSVFLIDTFFVLFRSFRGRCIGLIVPEDLF